MNARVGGVSELDFSPETAVQSHGEDTDALAISAATVE
jgi:hypothetical protein